MTERYWEAGEPPEALPEALLDWVNKNVCEAIKDSWETNNPRGWIDIDGGKVILTFAGPEKPDDEGDIFTMKLNLVEELAEYAAPYADIRGPRSEEQKEDMRERAAVLHKLAADISNMAAEADKCG